MLHCARHKRRWCNGLDMQPGEEPQNGAFLSMRWVISPEAHISLALAGQGKRENVRGSQTEAHDAVALPVVER